jgi:Ca2+-binding RTX toxin-like protein
LTLAIGAGVFAGQGNAADNVILGNQSANTLIGLDGNDTLDGGPGADVLLGGRGNDLYRVDDTLDLVDEGSAFPGYPGGAADVDTVVSAALWFWDVYSVGEILQVDALNTAGTTTIIGSMFSNQMIGNTGSNVLFGRGGSDTYRAGDGVDYISVSTLGLTNADAYVGVDGNNLVVVDKRTTGPTSYDIIYEFDVAKDRIDVTSYGYADAAQVLAAGRDDGAGNCYFALGDGFDYVYLVGVTLDQVTAADFVV